MTVRRFKADEWGSQNVLVLASDYDALAARLAAAERLLRVMPKHGLAAHEEGPWWVARAAWLADSADAARCKTCGGSGYVAHVSMGGIEAGDCPRCNTAETVTEVQP